MVMQKFSRFLSSCICVAVIGPAPAYSDDLADIVSKAIANDPTLAGASADLRYAQRGVPLSRAVLLPQLAGTLELSEDRATGTLQGDSSGGSGPTRTRNGELALTQRLVDVQSMIAVRAAQATATSQGASYEDALQDLYLRAATAYFNVLENEMELEAYRASEEAAKEVWQQAATRNKAGLVASSDMQQARVFYESSQVDRLEVQKILKQAQESLAQIIGESPAALVPFPDTVKLIPPAPESEDAWVKMASNHSFGILSSTLALGAQEKTVAAARAGHLPTLNLGISHENAPSWRRNGGNYRSTDNIVGVTLNVPIFSGGLVQAQVGQAIATRDRSAADLEVRKRQVEAYVRTYYQASVLGIQQVERAAAAVAAASSAVSSVKTGLLAGTNDMTTVLNAIDYQVQAKALYNEQLSQFFINILALKRYAGTLSPDDISSVNELLKS